MPFFKLCDVSRTTRKAVVANSLEEIIAIGKKRLCLEEEEECRLFEEADGTEIEDLCLLEYDKGSLFVLGSEWIASPAGTACKSSETSQRVVTPERNAELELSPQEHAADLFLEVHEASEVNKGKSAELATSWQHVEKETCSREEDNIFSTAETSAQQGGKKKKHTEEHRSTQEHTAHFLPGAHMDEATKEEPENEYSEEEEVNASAEFHGVDEATTRKLDNDTYSEEEVVNCSTAETNAQPEDKKTRVLKDVLMQTPYRHARAKNIKIYTSKEIDSASGMEKKRRQFWNEKADQLSKNKETRDQSKTALCGIIDVSWTLKKTLMLEAEARKLLEDEKVIFRKEDTTSRKLGKQKKDTILKNVDRMCAAHQAVEEHDQTMTGIQKGFKKAKTIPDRKKSTKEYDREKLLMDGAYTELKRAQDALSKSIKVKRIEIENRLNVGTGAEDAEDTEPSTSGGV